MRSRPADTSDTSNPTGKDFEKGHRQPDQRIRVHDLELGHLGAELRQRLGAGALRLFLFDQEVGIARREVDLRHGDRELPRGHIEQARDETDAEAEAERWPEADHAAEFLVAMALDHDEDRAERDQHSEIAGDFAVGQHALVGQRDGQYREAAAGEKAREGAVGQDLAQHVRVSPVVVVRPH